MMEGTRSGCKRDQRDLPGKVAEERDATETQREREEELKGGHNIA